MRSAVNMSPKFDVLAKKRFDVDVVLGRPRSQPVLLNPTPVQKAGFQLGWCLGFLESRFGAMPHFVNAYLLCPVYASGLPAAVINIASLREWRYVAEFVAGWQDCELEKDDTVAALAWFERAGIDPVRGISRWVLAHLDELVCTFAFEVTELPRIGIRVVQISDTSTPATLDPIAKEESAALDDRVYVTPYTSIDSSAGLTESGIGEDERSSEPVEEQGGLFAEESPSSPDDLDAISTAEQPDRDVDEPDSAEALDDNDSGDRIAELPTSIEKPASSEAIRSFVIEQPILDRPRPTRISPASEEAGPLLLALPVDLRFMALFAELVLRDATRRGLMSRSLRWSLAELQAWGGIGKFLYRRMQAASFEWGYLKLWHGYVAGYHINAHEALGLAMLSHCAWVGRAKSDPGEIWKSVWDSLGSTARETWFQLEGSVRQNVRDAIRTACYRFGLRHAFDAGDTEQQAWLRTIQMQYGFSWNWEYLSEYHKPAIASDLMDPSSENYSAEFATLWECLLKFQRGLITKPAMERNLGGNPWLPADGVDGLLDRAERRPEQGRHDDTESPSGIFDEPGVHWPGAEPTGRVYLSEGLDELLSEDVYTLRVGRRLMPLRRTTDGFRIITGPDSGASCDVDLTQQRVGVAIERQGQPVISDEISFIPDNGLFSLYSAKSGKPVELEKPATLKTGYIFLCRSELTIRPELVGCEWRYVFGGGWMLTQLSGPLPPSFGVYLQDEKLWPAVYADNDADLAFESVRAVCEGGYWGEYARVRLTGLPDGVQPLRFVFAQHEFPISQDAAGSYIVEQFVLEPGLLHGVKQPRVRLRTWSQGRERIFDCSWVCPVIRGALVNADGAWKPLRGRSDKRYLKNARISVVLEEADGYVVNGNQICARLQNGRASLDGALISGWGEDLRAVYGLSTANRGCRLVEAVYDCGILTHVDFDPECERIVLSLDQAITPSDGHDVWRWTQGSARPEKSSVTASEGFQWFVPTCENDRPAFWAVSYNGIRLGSRWYGNRIEGILSPDLFGDDRWEEVARWLRWFKAPLLSTSLSGLVGRHATGMPVKTLRAWLLDDIALSEGARIGVDDGSGVGLVRHFLWDWIPSPEEAALALGSLGVLPNDYFTALMQGASQFTCVLEASPVLFASLIFWGLGQLYWDADAKSLSPICCKLRNQCSFGADAGKDNRISQSAWNENQESLLRAASGELGGVDTAYLSGAPLLETARNIVHRKFAKEADREALRLSFFSGSYRRWLAAKLLDDFHTVLISNE